MLVKLEEYESFLCLKLSNAKTIIDYSFWNNYVIDATTLLRFAELFDMDINAVHVTCHDPVRLFFFHKAF